MGKTVVIYVTTGSQEEATKIGRTLVEERLVACANLLPKIQSFYWWNAAVQEGAQTPLLLKTRKNLAKAVVARVKALHSDDCPCVIAMPIVRGNPDFLQWIENETWGGEAAGA